MSSEDSARLQTVKGTWEQGIKGPLGWAGAILVSGPRGPSSTRSIPDHGQEQELLMRRVGWRSALMRGHRSQALTGQQERVAEGRGGASKGRAKGCRCGGGVS